MQILQSSSVTSAHLGFLYRVRLSTALAALVDFSSSLITHTRCLPGRRSLEKLSNGGFEPRPSSLKVFKKTTTGRTGSTLQYCCIPILLSIRAFAHSGRARSVCSAKSDRVRGLGPHHTTVEMFHTAQAKYVFNSVRSYKCLRPRHRLSPGHPVYHSTVVCSFLASFFAGRRTRHFRAATSRKRVFSLVASRASARVHLRISTTLWNTGIVFADPCGMIKSVVLWIPLYLQYEDFVPVLPATIPTSIGPIASLPANIFLCGQQWLVSGE